jgi:hypothetical protein
LGQAVTVLRWVRWRQNRFPQVQRPFSLLMNLVGSSSWKSS